MQDIILLQCTSCKNKNYSTTKNKKNVTEKLVLKKYCRHCRKHVDHKETKE
ncbi:MAG: 50S ribosomal protein L33 [Nitrospirae bacterium]|nr:50S ribosomal protein L33 [Nitrospirota bacterium]